MKECAKRMAKVTAWFMSIYATCWLLLWLSITGITDSYEFNTFGYILQINRWFDLLFIAIHLNLLLAGFFWILPSLSKMDTDDGADSSAVNGGSLIFSFIVGLILIVNPKLENCINGSLLASLTVFLIGITTTRYAQSVLLATGSAIMTAFLPGMFGGGALNGLYAGLIVSVSVFMAGMIPYAIVKPILVKINESKTQTPP